MHICETHRPGPPAGGLVQATYGVIAHGGGAQDHRFYGILHLHMAYKPKFIKYKMHSSKKKAFLNDF